MRPYRIERIWSGSAVVIIGGGPSLNLAQIRQIAMARLDGRIRVIAVNDAVFAAWWADWLHACDGKWWRWHIQRVQHFAGIKTTLDKSVPGQWVDGVLGSTYRDDSGRECTMVQGFSDDPACVCTGGNGVYQSIQIAAHAGGKRVALFGVDMHGEHWFGEHPDRVSTDFQQTMVPHFETLLPGLQARGVEVVNASPGSALKTFRHVDTEEALA